MNEPPTDPHQTVSIPGQSIRFGSAFYEFAPLVPLYGSAFVFPLIIYFTEGFYDKASSGNAKRLLALRVFFGWTAKSALASPQSIACRIHAQLSAGVCPLEDDMNQLTEEYGDLIRDLENTTILPSMNKTYRATHLESVSAVLRNLAPYGLWPRVAPIRRIDDRGDAHIPALGQLGPGRTQIVFSGADAYARSVEASKARMVQLRRLAEDRLLSAHATLENGKRLLSLKDTETPAIIRQAVLQLTAYGENLLEPPLVEKVFPRNNADRRLANLLRYLDLELNGNIPSIKDVDGSYGLDLLIRACGGSAFVAAHLHGTKMALLCAHLITLIDTGMNVQPCVDMAAQPFAGEFRRGTVRLLSIISTKNRPQAKEVFSAVPVEGAEALLNAAGFKISTKTAINMWQDMSHRMRHRAEQMGNNAHRYLWICRKGTGYSGAIQQFGTAVAKSQMSLLLSSISDDLILGGIGFSRRNIRPTWLVIRNSKNINSHIVVTLANHSDGGVTFGAYLNRVEYRELLASMIRSFQDQLEAAMLVTDVSRLVHLSIDAETVIGRAEEAIRNGLGEILFDAGGAKADAICAMPEVELVPDGIENFLRFDPKHDDLVALVLVKGGLEASEEAFRVSNPERWRHKWMPGLALTSAVIARLNQSKFKMALKRASVAAEQGVRSGKHRLFTPW